MKIFFKLKTKIRNALVDFFKLNRQTSYPFISGDGFRSLAQHVFDDISDMKPELVETNDIIFVRNDFLLEFFEKKHPLIKNKYILVSHNTDANIGEEYEKYIDDKIVHWFTQNLEFKNKKVTPLPIGVTNYHYATTIGRGKICDLQENINTASPQDKITDKISFGFSYDKNHLNRRNIERMHLLEIISDDKNFEKIDPSSPSDYYKNLSRYKFTISPEGNGLDCYRTWESLYLKVVPIVKKNLISEYFKSIGIPLLIVEDWNELKSYNEKFLLEKYDELKQGFDSPQIYMYYWMNLIVSKRVK